jgi:hypothetical protein
MEVVVHLFSVSSPQGDVVKILILSFTQCCFLPTRRRRVSR